MSKNKRKSLFYNIAITFVIAIFFVFDLLLKRMAMLGAEFVMIKDYFLFSLTKNYYISFSIPFSGPILNTVISFVVLCLLSYIIYLLFNKKYRISDLFALIAIFLGASSNLLDRFINGFVIDYLELKYFTAFNLADVLIFLGSLWLIIRNLRGGLDETIE